MTFPWRTIHCNSPAFSLVAFKLSVDKHLDFNRLLHAVTFRITIQLQSDTHIHCHWVRTLLFKLWVLGTKSSVCLCTTHWRVHIQCHRAQHQCSHLHNLQHWQVMLVELCSSPVNADAGERGFIICIDLRIIGGWTSQYVVCWIHWLDMRASCSTPNFSIQCHTQA